MMMINQVTMMHGVINKAYMKKFKPLIEEGNKPSYDAIKK